jgi:protein ImuA
MEGRERHSVAGGFFAMAKLAEAGAKSPERDRRPPAEIIAALGARIARIEKRPPELESPERGRLEASAALSLGIAEIDAVLAGNGTGTTRVPAAALHEVRADAAPDAAAATGFALALGLRAAASARRGDAAMFWIAAPQVRREAGEFYGPGLQALGLAGARLIRVFPKSLSDALWAAGEVAAHKGAGLCLLELPGNPASADLAFSRRLALRAREAGVPVIVLRQGGGEEASAAMTRWRIAPAPSNPGPQAARKWLGPPAFAVTLEKCRGGRPGEWLMEWKSDERLFALAGSGAGVPVGAAGFPSAGLAGPPLSLARADRLADRPVGAAPARPGLAARRAS